MRDLYNILTPVHAFTSTALKATTAGPAVSTVGYDGVLFAVDVANYGDTLSGTVSYEIDVQESQDGSTFTAASDQNVQYAVGTANGAANTGAGALLNSGASGAGAAVLKIGYLGSAPYARLNIVVTGTMTNGTVISAQALLGFPRHAPAGVVQAP